MKQFVMGILRVFVVRRGSRSLGGLCLPDEAEVKNRSAIACHSE